MPRRLHLLTSLLLFALTACQLGGGPPPATPPPVGEISPDPAPLATATVAAPAPTQVSTPATSLLLPALAALQPIAASIPVSFTVAGGGDGGRFAKFPAVRQVGAPQPQRLTIAPDLANVQVATVLSPEQRERLGQHGFAISPDTTKEFYEIYERARYNFEPIFVSSDSLLHVYHLLFDKTLRRAEADSFIPMLTRLDWELLRASVAQAQQLQGGDPAWADAARRNAAYFAVAVKLLDPEWQVPTELADLVEPELASIAAHSGFGPSAIFPDYPNGEDWSQYVPRGHYTKSEALKRYFLAMMWHGRMTMRATSPSETRQAALMTLAWRDTRIDGIAARDVWNGIYLPTVFFVGRSDDLMPSEYQAALEEAYGGVQDVAALDDEAKFAAFQSAVKELRPPLILGMVIDETQPVDETTKGLRFMGQRFVPDSALFRQLIHRNVVDRRLPKGLDLFAVLGSERALGHLRDGGETRFPRYDEQMAKLQQQFAAYDEETWTQNLYWSWIYSLQPLLAVPDSGAPQFMQSPFWQDKQLVTALGSWTELRRDTILYAKQVYAERGAGGLPPPVPVPPKGYVEPVPLLYGRIAALAQMTIDGLKSRGLLHPNDENALAKMAELATALQTMAEKELAGQPLSEAEYEQIRFYGADIEALTFGASDEGEYGGRGGLPAGGEDLQAAVVADVATDPGSGQVLEQGVGRVFTIYVVAPIEGQLVVTKGGVFSHYEFTQPMSERLTDESWRELLDSGQAPPLEPWKQALLVEQNAAAPLQDVIVRFNDKLIEAEWYTDGSAVAPFLVAPELDDTTRYIDQLKAAGQFVGLYRERIEFLSFDFADANNAIVTTREFWREELRQGTAFDTSGPEPPIIGVRPPYSVGVTYTMTKQGEEWKISKIILSEDPATWQQP